MLKGQTALNSISVPAPVPREERVCLVLQIDFENQLILQKIQYKTNRHRIIILV